jgi:hypothetical protein
MLHLTVEERQELVRIIESLSTFTIGGPRGRLNVIEQAGLQRFLSGIDLAAHGMRNELTTNKPGGLVRSQKREKSGKTDKNVSP